jgi:hypothetical protein
MWLMAACIFAHACDLWGDAPAPDAQRPDERADVFRAGVPACARGGCMQAKLGALPHALLLGVAHSGLFSRIS